MKIRVQQGNKPEQDAELFVVGAYLGLVVDEVTTCIVLTVEQWKLLERSAHDRAVQP
jgi:hypothetical protein